MTQQPPGQPPGDDYPPLQSQGDAYWHSSPPPWLAAGAGHWPQSPYTSWIERVGAPLIDALIPAVIGAIGLIIAASMGREDLTFR
jgi:hypothetical protein